MNYDIRDINMPLVSFVLLAYNQEAFVREAIEAAFAQTYQNLEIVLSDDCSRDGTFAVMEQLVAGYDGPHRVVLNRNEKNLGIGPHVEYAVGLSSGSYAVMAGGDDISMPDRVAKSMEVVERHGELGAVFGRCRGFSGTFNASADLESGKWEPEIAATEWIVRDRPEDWLSFSRKGKVLNAPGSLAMWNRKLFTRFSPMVDGVIAEDLLLGCRALFSGMGVAYTPAKMVHFRVHDANCFNGVSKELFARRALFTWAMIHRDVLALQRKEPGLYDPAMWDKIIRYYETALYRAIVVARRNDIGRFWSRLLFLIGFRRGRRSG